MANKKLRQKKTTPVLKRGRLAAKIEAEQKIRELNRQLKKKVRELQIANEGLGTFSYTLSHDLRNPLTVITGLSQLLLSEYGEKMEPAMKESIRRIKANSERMAQLIKDILNLSYVSQKEIENEEVDLSDIAKDIAIELINNDLTRRVDFVIKENLVTKGDAGLLRIMIENLLGNAWKYTGKRESSVIELGIMKSRKSTGRDGKNGLYYIRDNGVGFDMTQVDKLFEPFQRLHPKSEFDGTGVGLATVRRIIERHGGKVWAESTEGQGATFFFTINSSHF